MKQILQDKFELKQDGLYNKKTGNRAGSHRKDGYRNIYVNGKTYLEHRLIWCYVHGYMPIEIDHIDRNRSNNDITNLRESTRLENNRNKIHNFGIRKNCKKWTVEIKCKGKYYYLGRFNSYDEAFKARKEAENRLW